MEPQYGLITAQQPTLKRSRIEPIDIFWEWAGKHPLAAAAGDVLDAHKMETSVSNLVIIFLVCKNLTEEVHIRNWASEVKSILAECNLLPSGTATLVEKV